MSTRKKSIEVCNPEQRRHLLNTLEFAARDHRSHVDCEKIPAPTHIASARRNRDHFERIVRKYERKLMRARERRRIKVKRIESKIKEAILFHTPEKALKAVEKFCRSKF